MVFIETTFPRGGTVTKSTESSKITFGASQNKRKTKKQSDKKRILDHVGDQEIEAISAELLTLKTIQEGMILMGCVKEIDPVFLVVSLPGRLLGKVVASNISESYTKILNFYVDSSDPIENFRPLNEMYEIGQIVYAKVINIQVKDSGKYEISLSLKPADVHQNIYHEKIRKGMVFNGAVEEVQEHGYIIECGIKNLRCFLPLGKGQLNYSEGQLIFMKIEKLTQTSSASTAVCKAVAGGNCKIKDLIEANLDYIVPSTVVNFTVTKILKNGLRGTIMNGSFNAYINEHHLHEPLATPNDYEVNSTLNARVLYVAPLTKLVYLSLNFNLTQYNQKNYEIGDFVENATVDRIGTGGLILDLDGKCKGLISFKSIKSSCIGNFDSDQVLEKYAKKTKLKVRITNFIPMDSLYICTDNPNIVNEHFYTLADLKSGEFVTATVLGNDKSGGYFVRIGNVRGLIEKMFLSSTSLHLSENSKLRCRIMGVSSDRNIAYLTNRPEYMTKECKLLTKVSKAKEKNIFLGTVVKILDKFLIVKFFNNIKAIFYKNNGPDSITNEMLSFYEGQTTNFRIVRIDGDKIIVGLADISCKPGDIFTAKVDRVLENGLEVILNENHMKSLVPTKLLSDFPELTNIHLKTFEPGMDLEIVCIEKNIFSVRDVNHFKNAPPKSWKNIQPGDILRGFIKKVETDIVEIMVPLKGYNILEKVHMDSFLVKAFQNSSIVVYPDQVVYVKVLSKEPVTKNITIAAKLTQVWDRNLETTVNIFAKYLDELKGIKQATKRQGKAIGDVEIGDIVSAKVISYNEETKDCFVGLRDNVPGIIKRIFISKMEAAHSIGKSLSCIVLWIDYLNEIVFLSHKESERERITKGTSFPDNIVKQVGVNGRVLIKTNDLIVCSIKKGRNPVVLVPTRIHYNDFEDSIGNGIKEGELCCLVVIHGKYPIAVFESTWKLCKKINKKRKLSNSNEQLVSKRIKQDKPCITKDNVKGLPVSEVRATTEYKDDENSGKLPDKFEKKEDNNEESNLREFCKPLEVVKLHNQTRKRTNSETKHLGDEKNKKTTTNIIEQFRKDMNTEEGIHKKEQKVVNIKPALPGAFGFWLSDLQTLSKHPKVMDDNEISDDDDDADKASENNKRKKLTPAERFRAAREEEARLREIEEKYANPNIQPETVDQFDRLVLSNPNSSKKWIEYMVFHLTAAEIDKARAIARKAIKSINFREEQELINVWIALINLELFYGTTESFDEVLKESLLSNDAYKIYTLLIKTLVDAQKLKELTDICTTLTKKFKHKLETWKIVASAYFDIGLPEKAKQMLHKALGCLPERDHINTIVTFANLNYKYGDKETAHTLLEQVLTSYPKRVDVWSQYIDMLIKDKEIESARKTLERAVVQKIPLKKMRTLFKKYLEFEERFGTEGTVQNVKQMAANYVQKEISS